MDPDTDPQHCLLSMCCQDSAATLKLNGRCDFVMAEVLKLLRLVYPTYLPTYTVKVNDGLQLPVRKRGGIQYIHRTLRGRLGEMLCPSPRLSYILKKWST
jgi:hypothetical protein